LTASIENSQQFLHRPGYALNNEEFLANLRAMQQVFGAAQVAFLTEALRISGHQATRDTRAARTITDGATLTPHAPWVHLPP
jgi:hypothetical protein